MGKDNLDEIRFLAETFRQAIENYIDTHTPITQLLLHFPRGNCLLTSGFLQKFLFENGIETDLLLEQSVCREDMETHSWLLFNDEIIIDITGDEFKARNDKYKYDIPVYVGPMDSFHKLFTIDRREPYNDPGTSNYVLPVERNNNMDYEEIKKIALKIMQNTKT